MSSAPTLWEITDHACRVCQGRVLINRSSDGALARCSCCGLTRAVPGKDVHLARLAICFCGAKPKGSGKIKMICIKQDCPTPEFPDQIVVQEAP